MIEVEREIWVTDKTTFTMAELFDYVETPEGKRQLEREERQFRKGYYHAILDVINAFSQGVLPRQLFQFAEGVLYDWNYVQPSSEIIEPPKFPEAWGFVAKRILKRDNHICHYCGGHADSVDHKHPVRFGGTDDESNLVASCRSCNSRKHTTAYDNFVRLCR